MRFFRLPTFCVMIVQGIFGTMPWTALSFMALFFQLSGISDGQAAPTLRNPLGGFWRVIATSRRMYRGRLKVRSGGSRAA